MSFPQFPKTYLLGVFQRKKCLNFLVYAEMCTEIRAIFVFLRTPTSLIFSDLIPSKGHAAKIWEETFCKLHLLWKSN